MTYICKENYGVHLVRCYKSKACFKAGKDEYCFFNLEMEGNEMNSMDLLKEIAINDTVVLYEKDKEYGSSWKKRGGASAFFNFCRKWDRIEHAVEKLKWDIFEAAKIDTRQEGIIDDIRDLRRYLLLVEAEINYRAQTQIRD